MNKTLKFTYEKETPGTYRYQEEPGENDEVVVGTLYIKKSALGDETRPDEITVTIKSK